jgi:hypothetical protein
MPTPDEQLSSIEVMAQRLSEAEEHRKANAQKLNFVAWLSSGFGALATVLGVTVIITGGSFVVVDRSEAAGRQSGKDAALIEIAPVKAEIQFNSKRMDFVVEQQREQRDEYRAVEHAKQNGMPLAAVLRPLAPLPARSDAGLP